MTKAEFEKLVTEYGDAMATLGRDPEGSDWRMMVNTAAAAKQAVLDAWEKEKHDE